MLFNSFVFLFAFLPVAYVVFWMLRSASSRYVWLALTGYVFYGYWDARFTLLMAFSTMVSYRPDWAFSVVRPTASSVVPGCADCR